MKIVSLLPSATEIVFALDLGDDLEGVTYECDFPAEARSKPVVSDTALPKGRSLPPAEIDRLVRGFMARREPIYVLDKDLIQRIQPDLILAQDLCRVCAVPSGQVEDALDELGCRAEVLSLDPHSLDDVVECVARVGTATGSKERAAEVVSGLRRRVEAVRAAARSLPPVPTLCLEWSDPPWVGGHWVPQMVEIAGGANLLNAPGEASRPVTWPDVASAGPEAIVFMPCGLSLGEAQDEASELTSHPEVAESAAARNGAVFTVDASSYFSRPGPRLVDGLEALAWALHPEAFPPPPAGRIAAV